MSIHLRKLEMKDADGMYEWMTDPEITCFFRFDASAVTIDTCRKFIQHAYDDQHTMHYAIADENDEYLGTISLKNITEKDAEYAISTRKKAHGTGAAYEATNMLLDIATDEFRLTEVYLNVIKKNSRAKKFYFKCGFQEIENNRFSVQKDDLLLDWYEINLADRRK